ncbi:MAG: hypothetical protein AABX04_05925 [Nanoarchaeota archaeon]
MAEDKIQKVKLVGTLYTTRQVVGLIKDIVMLIFLLVLIFGGIALVALASQIQLPF